jgi:hypothetical protein
MEKRSRHRIARRITCTIEDGARRATGIVHNVSEHGLFVQTHFAAAPDSLVHVVFRRPDDIEEIRIEAGVARKRVVPRQLTGKVPSGLGLEVIPPRHEFDRLVGRLEPLDVSDASDALTLSAYASADQLAISAFRIRMVRHDQLGSRVVTVRCATESSARARALTRLGADWKIATVQKL